MVAEAGLGLLWGAGPWAGPDRPEFRATASCLLPGGLTILEVSVGTGGKGDWVVPASHAFWGLVLQVAEDLLQAAQVVLFPSSELYKSDC